jgi:hypothetical protein
LLSSSSALLSSPSTFIFISSWHRARTPPSWCDFRGSENSRGDFRGFDNQSGKYRILSSWSLRFTFKVGLHIHTKGVRSRFITGRILKYFIKK